MIKNLLREVFKELDDLEDYDKKVARHQASLNSYKEKLKQCKVIEDELMLAVNELAGSMELETKQLTIEEAAIADKSTQTATDALPWSDRHRQKGSPSLVKEVGDHKTKTVCYQNLNSHAERIKRQFHRIDKNMWAKEDSANESTTDKKGKWYAMFWNTSSEDELNHYKTQNEQLRKTINHLTEDISEIKKIFLDVHETLETYQKNDRESLGQLSSELSNVKDKESQIKLEIDKMYDAIRTLQDKEERAKKEISALNEIVMKYKDYDEQNKKYIEELKAALKNNQSKENQYKEQLKRYEKTLKSMKQQNTSPAQHKAKSDSKETDPMGIYQRYEHLKAIDPFRAYRR
ncbi:hypothetical protein PQ478_12580 [Alkalihalophilus pseudofirmus]|uniref:hypothetical protein n=1 Tax=Alkalihalophilus pseudofirmus TaxID=79885 RepID=UPI00259BBED9|nr:hypothetical protein [Alkalihalophilus pseudofirmus]WEG15375.1 hypothetical protein PQ478_12580 [Alkalihalophilus pseudofirmus]